MKLLLVSLIFISLSSCAGNYYTGPRVTPDSNGKLLCGKHTCPVKTISGYSFAGLMSGSPDFEFAATRCPNLIGPGFQETKSTDYRRPTKAYSCEMCYADLEKLSKLPQWYQDFVLSRDLKNGKHLMNDTN